MKMKFSLKNLVVIFFLFIAQASVGQQHAFYEEIKAFKEQDKADFPAKDAILFVGSSSFRMWHDVQKYFPDFPVINRGFGGSSLANVIYYADDIIFPYSPRQVVIYCGENDLTEPNVDAAVVYDRFKILFEMIRKRFPDIPVTYVSMKPSPSREKFRPAMAAGNEAIRHFLTLRPHTSYVDVYSLMLGENGKPLPEIFKSDSLHMNELGYKIWQGAISPHLIR